MTSLTTNTLTFDSGSLEYNDITKNMAGESTMVAASNSTLNFQSMQVGQTVYGGGQMLSGIQYRINLSPSGTYKLCGMVVVDQNPYAYSAYDIVDSSGGEVIWPNYFNGPNGYIMLIITRIS